MTVAATKTTTSHLMIRRRPFALASKPAAANATPARMSQGAMSNGPMAAAPSSSPQPIHGTQPDQLLADSRPANAIRAAANAIMATSAVSKRGTGEEVETGQ